MGNRNSTPKRVDKGVEKKLHTEAKQARRSIKALLLGPGGSGKSTILKQMSKIYYGVIEDKEMNNAVISIRKNIIYDMNDICILYVEERKKKNEIILSCEQNQFDLCYKFMSSQRKQEHDSLADENNDKKEEKEEEEEKEKEKEKEVEAQKNAKQLESVKQRGEQQRRNKQTKKKAEENEHSDMGKKKDEVLYSKEEIEPLIIKLSTIQPGLPDDTVIQLTPVIAKKIAKLWKYPGIKYAYELRKLSHVMDNTPWLFDRAETIADPNYQGSFEAY
ncbi:hypothetical protein RFI_24624, partial [Reticulomyxa filosa]